MGNLGVGPHLKFHATGAEIQLSPDLGSKFIRQETT